MEALQVLEGHPPLYLPMGKDGAAILELNCQTGLGMPVKVKGLTGIITIRKSERLTALR
jgi:hypothetical protein